MLPEKLAASSVAKECLALDLRDSHAESNTDSKLDKLDLALSCDLHNKNIINSLVLGWF